MRARWNGSTIAESEDIVTVEGNPYFPMGTLRREFITESATHTTCSWKGVASYFDLVVDGKVNRDAVWYYPAPKPGAEQVAGRVAFWRGVVIEP